MELESSNTPADVVTRPEVEFHQHLHPSGIPLKQPSENGWYRFGIATTSSAEVPVFHLLRNMVNSGPLRGAQARRTCYVHLFYIRILKMVVDNCKLHNAEHNNQLTWNSYQYAQAQDFALESLVSSWNISAIIMLCGIHGRNHDDSEIFLFK